MGKQHQEEGSQANLAVTYKDRFPPGMFESTAQDLIIKAESLGLDRANTIALNRERYMSNLKMLGKDGMKLAIMSDQTQEMVLHAVDQNPKAFIHVVDQTEQICEFALSRDSTLIQFFREQLPSQQLYAFVANVTNTALFVDIDEDTLDFMINQNPICFKYLPHQYRTKENFIKYLEAISYDYNVHDQNPLTWLPDDVFTYSLFKKAANKNFNFLRGMSTEWHLKFIKDNKDVIEFLNEHRSIICERGLSDEQTLEFFEAGVIKIIKYYTIGHLTKDILKQLVAISERKRFNLTAENIFKDFKDHREFDYWTKEMKEDGRFYHLVYDKYFKLSDGSSSYKFIKQVRKNRRDLIHRIKTTWTMKFWMYTVDKLIAPLI